MQEQSGIFDTDAMQSYLKNMKPIEQIFQYVFQGDSALKMTSDGLIYKLCQNTAEYLKDHGKTIGAMENADIREFYSKIEDICNSISHSLLGSESIALANLLHQDMKSEFNSVKASMASKADVQKSEQNIIRAIHEHEQHMQQNTMGSDSLNKIQITVQKISIVGTDVYKRQDKKYLSITKHIAYSKHKKYILTEKELQEMGKDENAEFPPVFLKRLAKDKENNTRMIKRILQIPENQSTLVYTCTVEQARWFAIYMLHYGRTAAYIDSDTGRNIRRGIIEKFKKGEIQFLFNYGVLTTGFDAPKVENIVLARPIRSEILYEQIIGRGIRGEAFGGTEFCSIIDFFDNTFIQGLPKSFERFRQYWDIDESGKWIHNVEITRQSDSIKQKIYVMDRLSECPICKNRLEDNYCIYKKNGKDKKLIVRHCTECYRNYITAKFNESSGFPNDYFETEKMF